MKRLFGLALAIVLAVAPGGWVRAGEPEAGKPASDRPAGDVLLAVPDNAWVVVLARNLGELDRKLTNMGQQMNFPFPISPLAMLKGHLGLVSGMDDNGGAAFVLMPSESDSLDLAKSMAFLVPTTNLKELINIMEPEDAGDGISKVNLDGKPAFVAAKGGYAVFAPTLELLRQVAGAKGSFASKCSPHQAERFKLDDLTVVANMEALTGSSVMAPVFEQLKVFKADPATLSDLRVVAFSLRVEAKGLRWGWFTDFKPGSKFGAVVGPIADKTLLAGLPKEKYFLALGTLMAKEQAAQMAKAFEAGMSAAAAQAGGNPEALARISSTLAAMVGRARGLSLSLSSLPEGPKGLIGMAGVFIGEGGAKESLDDLAKLADSVNEMAPKGKEGAKPAPLLELKRAAEKVGDVEVAKLELHIEKTSDVDAEKVNKVVGDEGIVFRFAAVDANRLAVTFGGGAARMASVIGLTKDGKAPLDEDAGIVRSRQSLPKERSGELFFAVDQLVAGFRAIMKAMDEDMPPVNMPEINAPLAMSAAPVGKTGSQVEVFMPMEMMTAIKDVAMGMMMGGMNPGGGPS